MAAESLGEAFRGRNTREAQTPDRRSAGRPRRNRPRPPDWRRPLFHPAVAAQGAKVGWWNPLCRPERARRC